MKEILLNQLEACIKYKRWNLKIERNEFGNMLIAPAWLEEVEDNRRFEISIEDNGNFFLNGTNYELEFNNITELMEILDGIYEFEV